MNNNNIGKLYSWPVIIIFLCIFWPIGLYLMIKRTSLDKATVMKSSSGKGLNITAIILIVLGGCGIIGSFEPFSISNIIIFLFFIVGGVVLLNKAKKIKEEGESVKKYLSIIVNNGERQLDSVAAATGKQYDIVKNEVQKMIDKGFLKNAYINENTREIVLHSASSTTTNADRPTSNVATPHQQTRVVSCPCCGANNSISGAFSECEYCGSALK